MGCLDRKIASSLLDFDPSETAGSDLEANVKKLRPKNADLGSMYSYIVRRLAFGAVTVIGVSIVVFFVLRVLPGDPLVAIFGPEGCSA